MHLLSMMESWLGVREACLCRDMSESPCSTRSLEVVSLSPMANIEFHAQEQTGTFRLWAVTGCVVVDGEGLRPRRLGGADADAGCRSFNNSTNFIYRKLVD